MEDVIKPQEEQFQKAEIFDTPEQLAQSMQADTQAAPPQPEQTPEPQETPYVDPEAAPQQEQTTLEQIADAQPQEEQPMQQAMQEEEYSDEEIEDAVLTFMSERLGRNIESFEDFSQPQQPAIDERVQAIADFVAETGHKPEDWFTYQSMNTTEMDDVTAMQFNTHSSTQTCHTTRSTRSLKADISSTLTSMMTPRFEHL